MTILRLTDDSDNARPVGMSYWPNINHHAGRDELYVLVSLSDVLTLFVVDKASLQVARRLPLPFFSTGEGCYFSLSDPDRIYVPQPNGLVAYNVAIGSSDLVVDVPDARQFHSSANGQVHSFSLGNMAAVWTRGRLRTIPAFGELDECQIDKSGRWLLIKDGNDNRIVDLASDDREWLITNAQGAVGHSDMGYGYMVGEDDHAEVGGAFRLWTFTEQGPEKGPIVHTMGDWSQMTRYVSHCNAQPGPPEGQRLLFSSAELGLVSRAIGGDPVPVCPSFTDLNAPGGGEVYWRHTRANLDPLGQFACFSGNQGTDRMDVFLVEIGA